MQIRKAKKMQRKMQRTTCFFLLVVCFLFACLFDVFSVFACFFSEKKKTTTKAQPFFVFLLFFVFFELFFFHLFFSCAFLFLRFPIACVLHLLGDPVLHLFFPIPLFLLFVCHFFQLRFCLRIILSGWHKTATSIQLTLPNRYCTL